MRYAGLSAAASDRVLRQTTIAANYNRRKLARSHEEESPRPEPLGLHALQASGTTAVHSSKQPHFTDLGETPIFGTIFPDFGETPIFAAIETIPFPERLLQIRDRRVVCGLRARVTQETSWSGFMAPEIGGDPLSELRLADVLGTLGFGASFEKTAIFLIDRFTGVASSRPGSTLTPSLTGEASKG